MRPEEVKDLLTGLTDGSVSIEDALRALRRLPVDDLGFARLDVHREVRQGVPEVIYGAGKTPEQIAQIAGRLLETTTGPVIATKIDDVAAAQLLNRFPEAVHHVVPRLVVVRADAQSETAGPIAVITAGTSDLPVALEAVVTAETLGLKVEFVQDVGVAGIHRLLEVQDLLHSTRAVIVVAGMEGALASVVAGVSPAPVIAVPTSVGYGASFDGLAALLAMLNSCVAGTAVMNIDNGFGAAVFAARLVRGTES